MGKRIRLLPTPSETRVQGGGHTGGQEGVWGVGVGGMKSILNVHCRLLNVWTDLMEGAVQVIDSLKTSLTASLHISQGSESILATLFLSEKCKVFRKTLKANI